MIMKLWIARDENGKLTLFKDKPIQKISRWIGESYWYASKPRGSITLDSYMFLGVNFENSPQEVELKLVKK